MMDNERRRADLIDEAIRRWAEQYNNEFLARMKGDDAMAYRLRGELRMCVLAAIERASKPKKSN
jgi:hypothetical protein